MSHLIDTRKTEQLTVTISINAFLADCFSIRATYKLFTIDTGNPGFTILAFTFIILSGIKTIYCCNRSIDYYN